MMVLEVGYPTFAILELGLQLPTYDGVKSGKWDLMLLKFLVCS